MNLDQARAVAQRLREGNNGWLPINDESANTIDGLIAEVERLHDLLGKANALARIRAERIESNSKAMFASADQISSLREKLTEAQAEVARLKEEVKALSNLAKRTTGKTVCRIGPMEVLLNEGNEK
jgi:predicted RNase H-like nuclease (RuvC/YqgF family)